MPLKTIDPNAFHGVDDVAAIFGMSKKWVYYSFSPQCPPAKTGVNGGGKSRWLGWQILAFAENKRLAGVTPKPQPRLRKPRRKKVA